mmetsp:Transcript_37611/g.97047  ORF Transcript_37611/g.97047 Transcript_37611/m.97047 type:complete len:196 (-) Transcript_37611:187-774(-)
MPKSKRQRVVPLTETRKKGLERKTSLVEEVRSCLEKYDKVILFEYQNFRNKKMKEMRESLTDSRFFLGRNAVTAKALGTTVEEEAAEGVHDIAIRMKGFSGLLFTNHSVDEVQNFFATNVEADFARMKATATRRVVIPEGPLSGETTPTSSEPMLRQLGLPTAIKKGMHGWSLLSVRLVEVYCLIQVLLSLSAIM